MKKIALALIATALLAGPALAQATARTDGEKKRDAEVDQAYRDALKRSNVGLPKQNKSDPWSDMRPAADNSKPDTTKK